MATVSTLQIFTILTFAISFGCYWSVWGGGWVEFTGISSFISITIWLILHLINCIPQIFINFLFVSVADEKITSKIIFIYSPTLKLLWGLLHFTSSYLCSKTFGHEIVDRQILTLCTKPSSWKQSAAFAYLSGYFKTVLCSCLDKLDSHVCCTFERYSKCAIVDVVTQNMVSSDCLFAGELVLLWLLSFGKLLQREC